MKYLLCLSFSFLMLGTVAFAQTETRRIAGQVVSQPDGKPVQGATVSVRNTANIVAADVNGNFIISAANGAILQISSIGYVTKTITITASSDQLKISLNEDVGRTEDVVVIGYGTTRRKDVTGAISSVTGDEIRRSQPTTIDQALQGKVAGVVVQQTSGQPGGGASVQIRGVSSFGNAQPLYVIDGVFIGSPAISGSGTNPLSSINPAEILSIDVLKDASATAIYGQAGSNGVVIITTKRGQVGPPKITYDGYAGSQSLPSHYDVMNLRDYAQFMNEKSGIIGYDYRPQFANPKYLGEGTNWQDVLFRNAPMQSHSIGISGGDARTQYFFSGSYFSQEGIALGSNFRRLSVRLNLDNKTTNWLKIGTSLQLANVKEKVNSTNSNVIQTALIQTPDVAAQSPNGSYPGNDPNIYGAAAANPFAVAQIIKDNKKRYQIFGNIYAEIYFGKHLTLRNEVSGDFDFGVQDQFTPTYQFGSQAPNRINAATYTNNQSSNLLARSYLTYNNRFNKISVTGLLGHEAGLRSYENVFARRTGFASNNVNTINAGTAATATNGGDKGSTAQESYFGRINLGYNDKYLLTLNARDDGSSNFRAGNRWVITYSGAFAWNIGNEDFVKKLNFFNDLKLRLGYGLVNNQNIRAGAYLSTLNTVSTGLTGNSAQQATNVPNPDAKWETSKSSNIGLDGSILKSRIQFSVDLYERKTNNFLLSTILPNYSGTVPANGYSPGALLSPYKNIGSVENKGYDISVTTINFQSRKANGFNWRSTFILSHNVNKIISLNSDNDFIQNGVARSAVGHSLAEFYGYQTLGIFTNAGDFKTHAAIPVNSATGVPLPITPGSGGIWVGDIIFKDVNGDGKITEQDQTFLGNPKPKYQLGFNNNFSYKNFDLTVFFSGSFGNKVYNQLNVSGTNPNQNFGYFKSVLNYAKIGYTNPSGSTTDINNAYIINPSTHIVRISQAGGNDNQRFSDRYVEDGSFARCKTIAIGYTFRQNLLTKAHLGSLRVYANVSNAFLITNYSGFDPEISSYDPTLAGVDNGYYPQSRVFTFGASLSLNK